MFLPHITIMIIARNRYLQKLINSRKNGQIKIITGIRRCGKSILLNELYREYLIHDGVMPDQIIALELDNDVNMRYRNPLELGKYIRERCSEASKDYYILLDEIQMVKAVPNPYLPNDSDSNITFIDVLLGLKSKPNLDVYVTGSNSKMLSSDILTTFRDRGEEIHVNPLTYDEFYAAYPNEKRYAWREFMNYGGMPLVLQKKSHEEKAKYLKDLFSLTYMKDVVERNKLKADIEVLDELLNFVASAVGSLTNPSRLANTFQSVKHINIKNSSISKYLDCFIDAFILSKSLRYDIKGKSYINTPLKYYFSDIGLRNARLNFRQQEENHIMENILYNELIARDFIVDVGVVEYNHKDEHGKLIRSQLEVDFIVNGSNKHYYIQSALTVAEESKRLQEINSLSRIDDSFTKIVVVRDYILPWTDERGIQYISIEDFLLEGINKL